ncbi:protein-L-isoaspartate O-methyltransferase [Methyloceanibacter superfactus]|uniref:Protein-L-isoaspartate O-methyltransferase n=1 Tax=Methyloceanibacter superfactus TaxID=1774969 RepID=A0A1E3VVX4_9HYPH|nr:protein-L-isoaspartate(D-aspartate) O-methyltransferase [Methyloceanibacter superfactus]ODR97688.1 protein-L-isoaspartate O-methyltransferase [Methyloceanibacter superfactus]
MTAFNGTQTGGRDALARDRAFMVARHLEARGIADPRVLTAMGQVPREMFVSGPLTEFAYEDSALPIEAGQTISQPYIVARMVELAELKPGDTVLEVGAGSGYAAAVMGRIASRVYAIERHKELADQARGRERTLGYDNVEIICADGTKGLPEHAPFDAIIVSAGGPKVPEALKRQLAIGGRLVIPVGRDVHQTLLLVRRIGEDSFEQEDHGGVTFVPLIGEEGWEAPETAKAETSIDAETSGFANGLLIPSQRAKTTRTTLSHVIADAAEPFGDLDELAAMAERFADRRVVLLGEATHGTAEFYDARARITELLVKKHGFNIVAVEADWPDAATYDALVRGLPRPGVPKAPFSRFPTWMWRNGQVAALLQRLKAVNETIADPDKRAGFYGLDVYSLGASIEAVLTYLDRVDPEAARIARQRYGCLAPWRAEPARYGHMALSSGYALCEKPVTDALLDLLHNRLGYLAKDGDAFFDAEQNARIVAAAEQYYRVMYYGSAQSWNLRDQHMFDTLERVLEHRGPDSKAVVWAHNSHIGDAAFTEMGQVRGEFNIGQLARARFGDDTALIGFGTDRGTVAAASNWDEPMEIKRVRTARDDSYEGRSRDAGIDAFFLETGAGQKDSVRAALAEPLLERAIGVIYRPETELLSHYFQAELSRQFDAWIWFTETQAVAARPQAHPHGPDETYPFGL